MYVCIYTYRIRTYFMKVHMYMSIYTYMCTYMYIRIYVYTWRILVYVTTRCSLTPTPFLVCIPQEVRVRFFLISIGTHLHCLPNKQLRRTFIMCSDACHFQENKKRGFQLFHSQHTHTHIVACLVINAFIVLLLKFGGF